MNSAAFCKGGKKGEVAELSHRSWGPSSSRAMRAGGEPLVRADPKGELPTSAFHTLEMGGA